MQVKVSLCMIVRDEARQIVECIQSVSHLVNEMIIVDTGSADATVQLATEMGAVVFSYPWDNDFAAARNYGIEKASGDWILILDADERLEAVSCEQFSALLREGADGYFIKIVSPIREGLSVLEEVAVRLFRRREQYRFRGAIHEQVIDSILAQNTIRGIIFSGLTISHNGYLSEVVIEKNKIQRNIEVICQALEHKPDDPFLLYSLAIERMQQGQRVEALGLLKSTLVKLDGGEGYFRHVLLSYLSGLLVTNDAASGRAVVNRWLSAFPDDPDLAVFGGIFAIQSNDFIHAAEHLTRALCRVTKIASVHQIRILLADCLNCLGNYEAAQQEYLRAMEEGFAVCYPLAQLAGIWKRERCGGNWRYIGRLLLDRGGSQVIDGRLEEGALPLKLVARILKLFAAVSGDLQVLQQTITEVKAVLEESDSVWTTKGSVQKRLAALYDKLVALVETYHTRQSAMVMQVVQMEQTVTTMLQVVLVELCPIWMPNPASEIERVIHCSDIGS